MHFDSISHVPSADHDHWSRSISYYSHRCIRSNPKYCMQQHFKKETAENAWKYIKLPNNRPGRYSATCLNSTTQTNPSTWLTDHHVDDAMVVGLSKHQMHVWTHNIASSSIGSAASIYSLTSRTYKDHRDHDHHHPTTPSPRRQKRRRLWPETAAETQLAAKLWARRSQNYLHRVCYHHSLDTIRI